MCSGARECEFLTNSIISQKDEGVNVFDSPGDPQQRPMLDLTPVSLF